MMNPTQAPRTHRRAANRSRGCTPTLLALPALHLSSPQGAAGQATNSVPPPPSLDYVAALRSREKDPSAAPLLFLAPMESLADRPLRQAHALTIGGMHEACTEFMRIPNKSENPPASVRGVCGPYDAWELQAAGVPLGAQVMGSNPELLSLATSYLLTTKRAPRVDLNCGCPANTVTGNGAGSSLLKTPDVLYECVKAMATTAAQHRGLLSVKMRAGYSDTALFADNLLAAQEGGAAFVTLHARTKAQTYEGRADWGLIRRARELLRIPVVGNGDVVSVAAAREMLAQSGAHGIMIGRGAVQDPLLFLRIRASFEAPDLPWALDEPAAVVEFLRSFASEAFKSRSELKHASSSGHSVTQQAVPPEDQQHRMTERGKMGRLKKVVKYLLMSSPELAHACEGLLRMSPESGATAQDLLEACCSAVTKHWPRDGPTRLTLRNHMSKSGSEAVTVIHEAGAAAATAGASRAAKTRQQAQLAGAGVQ